MDIKRIKEIIEDGWDGKENRILRVIGQDESAITSILEMLAHERKRKKKLLMNMNLELSRAHLGLEDPKINKDHFMDKEILKFYLKNKDQIGHSFKDLSKLELSSNDKELNFNDFND